MCFRGVLRLCVLCVLCELCVTYFSPNSKNSPATNGSFRGTTQGPHSPPQPPLTCFPRIGFLAGCWKNPFFVIPSAVRDLLFGYAPHPLFNGVVFASGYLGDLGPKHPALRRLFRHKSPKLPP